MRASTRCEGHFNPLKTLWMLWKALQTRARDR